MGNINYLRRREVEAARQYLAGLEQNKVTLPRPVFFVPGWTDERGEAWLVPYRSGYVTMKEWIQRTVKNPEIALFVTFSDAESRQCRSFLDFARLVIQRVKDRIGLKTPCDVVGHSMGGLDLRAAISLHELPLQSVQHFITVGTPHRGTQWGDISRFRKLPAHQREQGINLDPDHEPIQQLNQLETRKRLLSRIGVLYSIMGLQDFVVQRTPKFDSTGLPETLAGKVHIFQVSNATHTDSGGLTQDLRVVAGILDAVRGIDINEPGNRGFVYRKV
jgi:hypothetical protein